MKVIWHAHLPGVSVVQNEEIPFARGRLIYLPFEDWSRMDPAFPFAVSRYENSHPLFYTGTIDFPDDADGCENQLFAEISRVHRAFLLHPAAPMLPSPFLSVIYLETEIDHAAGAFAFQRRFGPCEREWIVYGCTIAYSFDEEAMGAVRWALTALVGFDPVRAFPGVEAGFRTLEVTTRPEFWSAQRSAKGINAFIHCIAALEHIVLPAKQNALPEKKLTSAFGENTAAFTQRLRANVLEDSRQYSDLYRLRSRLIHGAMTITDLKDSDLNAFGLARRLLVNVIRRAIILSRVRNEGEDLPSLLAAAYGDSAAHETLHRRQAEALKQ
jgi:hypothetical protein